MEDKIIVQTATIDDLDAWLRLVMEMKEYFPGMEEDSYRQTVIKNLRRGSAVCAKAGNRLVGILLFSKNSNCLSQMAVHPDWQKRGIGADMVRLMLKKLDPARGVTVTTYRAEDPKGRAAREFYRRMGFAEGEERMEFGYPVQQFVLRRKE